MYNVKFCNRFNTVEWTTNELDVEEAKLVVYFLKEIEKIEDEMEVAKECSKSSKERKTFCKSNATSIAKLDEQPFIECTQPQKNSLKWMYPNLDLSQVSITKANELIKEWNQKHKK